MLLRCSTDICPKELTRDMREYFNSLLTFGRLIQRTQVDLFLRIVGVHHVAIICSNYDESRRFYSEILGLTIISETHRADRGSYKIDLALPDGTQIELFSFPDPPPRASYPEACGLRHLAFAVQDLDSAVAALAGRGVPVEDVRVDELTGKRFTFFADPDGLPLELYEERSR